MATPKNPPTLAAVAADEKTKKEAKSVLSSLAALLGLGSDAKPAAGKMRKVTETHKHVKLEEEEGGTDSDEEEEEEEEMDSETDKSEPGSETDDSEAEEEEEEEEERSSKGKGAKYEEEEEEEASVKGLGRALRAAYKSPKVKAAFLAAIPENLRAAASLRAPDRVVREMCRATGARTIDGAMTNLSRQRSKAAAGDAEVIKATAALSAKVAKVEASQRAERVEAIVQQAKAEGRATTKELRSQLRAHGNAHGTKALRALVASLPKVARTVEDGGRAPRTDASGHVVGAPGVEQQVSQMAMADLSPEARELYEKTRATVAAAKNGAATPKGGF